MITQAEKQRLRGMITETITLLCKSGLSDKFEEEFFIEGLIGITLDHQELMMVSIREKVMTGNFEDDKCESSDESTVTVEDKTTRKRKKSNVDGPREKTSKHEHIEPSPKKSLPSSPLLKKPVINPFHTPPSLNTSPGLDPFKQPLLNNGPVNHLDRLKNLYLMSAGFPSAMNFQQAASLPSGLMDSALRTGKNTVQVSETQSDRNGAINLSIEKQSSMDPIKKEQDLTVAKDQNEIRIKQEETAQLPPPLLVQSIPTLQPYTSLYSSPLRHQAVFSEPLMVPHLQSPGLTPKRDVKLTEVLDRIKNNLDMNPDANRSRSISDHIAQNIVRSEGSFVTSRIIGRKTGRKAAAVKEVFLNLTTPITDKNHVGQAKEISRGTLVYYKCPPYLIKPEALTKYGLDMDIYKFLYNSEMKTPPSLHMLAIVDERSPYNPNGAKEFSTAYNFENPMIALGRMKGQSSMYGVNSGSENYKDKMIVDFVATKSENSDEFEGSKENLMPDEVGNDDDVIDEDDEPEDVDDDDDIDEQHNRESGNKAGIDFSSTFLPGDGNNGSNLYIGGTYAPTEQTDRKSASNSETQVEEDVNSEDSANHEVSNKENEEQQANMSDDKDINLNIDDGSKQVISEPEKDSEGDLRSSSAKAGLLLSDSSASAMASPLKGLEKLVSLQSTDG